MKRLRSDSAYYQADVINWGQRHEIGFTITTDQDVAVKEVIKTVRDWKPLWDAEGQETDRLVMASCIGMADRPNKIL